MCQESLSTNNVGINAVIASLPDNTIHNWADLEEVCIKNFEGVYKLSLPQNIFALAHNEKEITYATFS